MKANVIRDEFAKNLRTLVEKSGKSQRSISAELDISATTFNEWMQGHKYPRPENMIKLASYFGKIYNDDLSGNPPFELKNEALHNEALVEMFSCLQEDDELFEIVRTLSELDKGKRDAVKAFLSVLVKGGK